MLFGVYGEVRSKKDLTGPALLEMSGNATNRELRFIADRPIVSEAQTEARTHNCWKGTQQATHVSRHNPSGRTKKAFRPAPLEA